MQIKIQKILKYNHALKHTLCLLRDEVFVVYIKSIVGEFLLFYKK